MKILFLTSSFPRHRGDTASIFLEYLAKHIRNKKNEVHILAPDDALVDTNHSDDPKIHTHWFRYAPKSIQNLAYDAGILENLRNHPIRFLHIPSFIISMTVSLWHLSRKISPDIIHAHWLLPQGLIAVLVGKLLHIPVIITVHGGDAFALNNNLLSRLKQWTLAQCNAWTSNTQATSLACCSQEFIKKPVIIPMGIDSKLFGNGDAKTLRNQYGDHLQILLFVGRLAEKKGVKVLIESFTLIPQDIRQNCLLWIIGDGEERPALERQIKDSGVDNQIVLIGRIQNHKLPDYYRAADIFIAPSIVDQLGDTEGQGVVLLEALASKTAIVSTTVGGISEVLTDKENAILVEPNAPEPLSNAIATLIKKPQLRSKLAENGFKEVQTKYEWNNIANEFIKLYLEFKAG